jgi:hypothetical protein
MNTRLALHGIGILLTLIAGLELCAVFAHGQAKPEITANAVAEKMDVLREQVVVEVTEAMKASAHTTSYTTVWRNFEEAAIEGLCSSLKRHVTGLTDKHLDLGVQGREKNRLADLAVVCTDGTVEVSIKASRRSENPENDMGTFREYPIRKRRFVASFTLWVRYDDTAKDIRLDKVFFDRSYRFVGRSSVVDGVKYRRKDGNMRPKTWAMFESGESHWKTEGEFESAVKRSELHRAKQIVNQYMEALSEEEQRTLYENLKRKFGDVPETKRP